MLFGFQLTEKYSKKESENTDLKMKLKQVTMQVLTHLEHTCLSDNFVTLNSAKKTFVAEV